MQQQPSYYRTRIFLFDDLIGRLPSNSKKKNAPRELLKQGYWSPELGAEANENLAYRTSIRQHEIKPAGGRYDDEDLKINDQRIALANEEPLKFSEITKYSTWFAMHPEKIAGTEVVTTSLFFPVKVKGTDDDVKRVIRAGIENINKPVEKPKNTSLLKMKMKAKALMLLLELEDNPQPQPEKKTAKLRDDNEIVTRENTDFQKEYDYYNNLCFYGKLKNVPLEWNMKRDKLGFVQARGKWNDLASYVILRLSISLFNKITYKSFVDTLVHEMIHVYIISNAIRDTGSHGIVFRKEMKRINDMNLGIDITITGDTSGFEISDAIKPKELVVALIYKQGKRYGIANYIRALYNDIPRYYQSFRKEFIDKHGFAFKIVLSNNPQLQQYKVFNKFNPSKIVAFGVPDTLFDSLESEKALSGIETEQITTITIY